jgi:hypothetical protein
VVPSVASAGLTTLVNLCKQVRRTGCSICIVDARPQVQWRLDLVGLGRGKAHLTRIDPATPLEAHHGRSPRGRRSLAGPPCGPPTHRPTRDLAQGANQGIHGLDRVTGLPR